jgi:hypothetical protein
LWPLARRLIKRFIKKGWMMKNWIIGLALSSVLAACVTINIYFPAAAAEKAADMIIDDVWQLQSGGKTAPLEPSTSSPAQ